MYWNAYYSGGVGKSTFSLDNMRHDFICPRGQLEAALYWSITTINNAIRFIFASPNRPSCNRDSVLHVIYIHSHTVVFRSHMAETIKDSFDLLVLHTGTQNWCPGESWINLSTGDACLLIWINSAEVHIHYLLECHCVNVLLFFFSL